MLEKLPMIAINWWISRNGTDYRDIGKFYNLGYLSVSSKFYLTDGADKTKPEARYLTDIG